MVRKLFEASLWRRARERSQASAAAYDTQSTQATQSLHRSPYASQFEERLSASTRLDVQDVLDDDPHASMALVNGVLMVKYVWLMLDNGGKEKHFFNLFPSATSFLLEVGIRIYRERKKGISDYDPEYVETHPMDGGEFPAGTPHGEAMVKVHERLSYLSWQYTRVEVRSTMSQEEAETHATIDLTKRKLKMGHSVIIDDSMGAGQPEHCVPSAFEDHGDSRCVVRGLRDLGEARAQQGTGKKRRRVVLRGPTPAQKKAKRAGALYMDNEADVDQVLRELCEGCNPDEGVSIDQIDDICKQVKWSLIVLNRHNVVIFFANHTTAASVKEGNYGRRCCAVMYAEHGHAYFVSDKDEVNHIRNTVMHCKKPVNFHVKFSPEEMKKAGLVKTSKGGTVMADVMTDTRKIVRVKKDEELPPFEQLQPVIYEIGQARLVAEHHKYTDSHGKLPCPRLERRSMRTLHEFSVFLGKTGREHKVTFMAPASFSRPVSYNPLIAEMMCQLEEGKRFEGDAEAYARKCLLTGPGVKVMEAFTKVMSARRVPSEETKKKVLRKQNNTCKLCGVGFDLRPKPSKKRKRGDDDDDDEEPVSDSDEDAPVQILPHWEHMHPHMDGGCDPTPQNIAAVCLDCMKEKNAHEREASAYRGVHRGYTSMYNASVRATLYPPHDKKLRDIHPTRTLARTEWITDEVVEGNLEFEVDVVKCRRNLLGGELLCDELGDLEWPVFSVCDDWAPYGGNPRKPGFYIVNTDDRTIFHGYGYYYHCTVVYGLQVGLIEESQILKQLIATRRTLPRDFFKKPMREMERHINEAHAVVKASRQGDDGDLADALKWVQKDFLGNIFVGVAGKAVNKYYKEYVTFCKDEACAKRREPGYVVQPREGSFNGMTQYVISKVDITDRDEDCRPIYHMIVEMERIQMHQMAKKAEAMGGFIKYFKTDAIGISIHPDKWNEEAFSLATYDYVAPWTDTPAHPETGKQLCFTVGPIGGLYSRHHPQLCRAAPHFLPRPVTQWIDPPQPKVNYDTPFTLAAAGGVARIATPPPKRPRRVALTPRTKEGIFFTMGRETKEVMRDQAEKIIECGLSRCITGKGGSGKSTLGRMCVDVLVKKRIRYLILAPTCKVQAAWRGYENCENAQTIQYLLKLCKQKNGSSTIRRRFGIGAEPFYFIIDEVSMVDQSMYEMFNNLKHMTPALHMLILGDFEQLPPVNDSWLRSQNVETYENTAAMRCLVDGNRLTLTHCHRLEAGEEEHLKVCDMARAGLEIADLYERYAVKKPHPVLSVIYTNEKKKEINIQRDAWFLENHPDQDTEPIVVEKTRPIELDLYLKVGSRLAGIRKGGSKPKREDRTLFPDGVTHKIVKRQLYEVVAVDAKELELKTIGAEHEATVIIPTETATRFLERGWAVTLYCIQGDKITETYTIYEYNHFYGKDPRCRNVSLTRAVRGELVQIDPSDRPVDTLRPAITATLNRPSQRVERHEFIDAKAWEALCAAVCQHLNCEEHDAGIEYICRIQDGVKRFDVEEETQFFLPTTYRITTGRRTARVSDGISLQGMKSSIRSFLLGERGHDLDIRSAHPTLLQQYLEKSEGAPATPCLREYVASRARVHERIAAELAAAGKEGVEVKSIVVRVMFLDSLYGMELQSPTLVSLAADFAEAAGFVVTANPQAYANSQARHLNDPDGDERGIKAGAVSEVLNSIETEVVAAIEDCFVQECGLCVRAVIYDGLVVHRTDPHDDSIDPKHLRLAEQRAKETTGYVIELVEKEMYRKNGAAELDAIIEFLRAYE